MNERIARMLIATAIAVASLTPAVASAQGHPLPQHVLSRGLVDRPQTRTAMQQTRLTPQKNDRLLYGRIDAIRGDMLVVRTRRGAAQHVNGTDAIKAGMYSQPLFVGKLVLISGYYDAARTLHAETIARQARLDAHTGPDR